MDQIHIKLLEEKVRLLQDKIFGRKSEKLTPSKYHQLSLFDEAEEIADTSPPDEDDDKIHVPAHNRKKRGRKPLPEHLPRIDMIHDLAEEEKICACGAKRERI